MSRWHATMTHFGDPCIHCDIAQAEVPVGPCQGDAAKARILAYCVARQAWENPGSGCMTVRYAMSDGTLREEAWHPSEYFAFNKHVENAKTLAPREFVARYQRPQA